MRRRAYIVMQVDLADGVTAEAAAAGICANARTHGWGEMVDYAAVSADRLLAAIDTVMPRPVDPTPGYDQAPLFEVPR